jgi:ATP-dependent Zn protease
MKIIMTYIIALVSVVITGCGRERFIEIPYSPDFVRLVESNKVNEVEFTHDGAGIYWIRGKIKSGEALGTPEKFEVRITRLDESVMTLLKDNDVVTNISHTKSMTAPDILPWLIVLTWLSIIIFVLRLALRFVRAVERIAKNMDK